MKKQYISFAFLTLLGVSTIVPAFALGGWGGREGKDMRGGMPGIGMTRPAGMGTVTAINGGTITVSGELGTSTSRGKDVAKVTFTVNASNATVIKDNATSSLSAIAVGDMLSVQGTVTGTNIVATHIRDGHMMKAGDRMMRGNVHASSTKPNGMMAQMVGNGQPVIAGNVTAINGNSLTISNKSNIVYTVDVTNAKVMVHNATSSVSAIAVNDTVVVQGAINGTSVTASTVMDSGVQNTTINTQTATRNKGGHGFLGGITGFFSHLFGF